MTPSLTMPNRRQIALFACCLGLSAFAGPPPGYELVWSDEFDGTELDTSRWVHRTTTRNGPDGKPVSVCLPENIALEDGKVRIDLRVDPSQDPPMTCGGVITRERFKYGYYETRVKMDGGYGWHEAFWTTATTDFDLTEEEAAYPRIEIDAFEHYAVHDPNEYTWGVIEWHPVRGGLAREKVVYEHDLSERYTTFAFEFTPDYMNFYHEGELLGTVDVRHVPHNRHHVWLSCIGTRGPKGVEDGAAFFDYLRIYEIDFQSDAYDERRREFVRGFMHVADHTPSAGTDIWIEPERFVNVGDWTVGRERGDTIVRGAIDQDTDQPWWRKAASTQIELPEAGPYRLWVRSRDYETNAPKTRTFRVAVNGEYSGRTFGTHGQEGMRWEDGGMFRLPKGTVTLELIDSSRFYARVDKLLLTTDEFYQPRGPGGVENVRHGWDGAKAKSAKP